jgi:diguanylate cyclase (GGDEF)-like protein/PAS domain S-box-containing protein
MSIHGSYDPLLVSLSVAVAIFASFTALNLAGRLLATDGAARSWWLLAASLALGGGIWSMHFVGMLAFNMPSPATYEVRLTLLSLLLPVLVTGAGFHTVSRYGNGWRPLLAAGLLAGLGVVVMHYSGMAAMRMPGISLSYAPRLVAASIAIAIVAATAAFWLAFRMSKTWERLAAAVVMGIAIAGMHYTAMAAARFSMVEHPHAMLGPVIQPGILAVAVVSAASILLLLGLLTAFFDRKLATLTAREAQALRQSEERHRALIRNASDIVGILDRDGAFIYEGSSARNVLGYRTSELVGRSLTSLVAPEQAAETRRFLDSILQEAGAQITFELGVRHSDGTWRDFEVIAKNLVEEPAIGGVVINLRDITERKLLMAALEKLSETDPLTGALNRRGFLKLAERDTERLRRAGGPLSVIMIDIDHFKRVNDAYGHAAGDLVLATVADECRAQIRAGDLLARFGGEEFIVLMTDCPPEAAHEIVERLRGAIAAASLRTIKGEVSVTASFGIATVDAGTIDLETAIRLSDEALYEAKNAGRNCIKVRMAAAS